MGFEIIGRILGDGSGWSSALKKGEAEALTFGGSVNRAMTGMVAGLQGRLAAAFGVGALIEAGRRAIEYGGRITDTAAKIGVGTTALQQFEYAAQQNGASLEEIDTAFRGLALARQSALEGDAGKLAAFGAVGITETVLRAESLEQIFKRIAAAIQSTDFGSGELALAAELLGKSGGSLIPMMKDGLAGLIDEAKRLGLALDENLIRQLDAAGDSADRLATRMRGPIAQLTGWVAQGLSNAFDATRMGIGSFGSAAGAFVGTPGILAPFRAAWNAFLGNVDQVITEYGQDQGILAGGQSRADRQPGAFNSLDPAAAAREREEARAAVAEATKILDLKQQILEANRALMTQGEKKASLEKERAALQDEIAALKQARDVLPDAGIAESEILRKQLRLTRVEGEIQQTDRDSAKTADALTRVGILAGPGAPQSASDQIQERQTDLLAEIARNTQARREVWDELSWRVMEPAVTERQPTTDPIPERQLTTLEAIRRDLDRMVETTPMPFGGELW